MKLESDGIRKVAIVVSSLPASAVDRLLDCFTAEQARQVRQAIFDLDEVNAHDEQQVLEEFFSVGPRLKNVEPRGLERRSAVGDVYIPSTVGPIEQEKNHEKTATPFKASPPFRFLRDAEADKLTRILSGERPQTIALVLSHLSPEQAARVLARLAGPLQVDVVHRLIDLEETDPAILEEVEQALESRLSQQVDMQRRRVAGWQAVAGILEASPQAEGSQIRHTLAASDPWLAEKFAPPTIEFDDLMDADDRTWSVLIQAVEPEVALLALFGAPPSLTERILRRLPTAEAAAWRRKLANPGPLRLSDVEEARRELAEAARRLANEGRIQFVGKTRPAMGVAA